MRSSVNSGDLRHRVIIQSQGEGVESGGEIIPQASNVATVWAAIRPRGGSESVTGPQVTGTVTHDVYVRYQSALASIAPKWRVLFGSRRLHIVSVTRIEEIKVWLQLECQEVV